MKLLILASLLALAVATGCTAIDREADCSSICNRYKDCGAPSGYDVSACTTRCRDYAAQNDENDNRVDICRNCTADRSCVSSAFNCASECSGVGL